MRARQLLLSIGLGLLGASRSALAQDAADINDAYEKAADGLRQYKAGHYAEALDDYTRAYAIVHLPALAVHIARANVKLGRFVAAKQFYDEALTLPDGLGDPQVQARARVEARSEGQALLTRIPRLLFRTSGVSPAGVTIQVDRAVIPSSAYGSWLVDPGSHQVSASFGEQQQARWIAVSEGEVREVTFAFVPTTTRASAAAPPTQATRNPQAPSNTRTLAWVGMGVGGAGLLVWGTAGLIALSKSNHLKSSGCGGTNPPCPETELHSYNQWKTVSGVGFYTGTAALVSGAALYFLAPRQKKSRDAIGGVIPWVGVGSAGVEGQF